MIKDAAIILMVFSMYIGLGVFSYYSFVKYDRDKENGWRVSGFISGGIFILITLYLILNSTIVIFPLLFS